MISDWWIYNKMKNKQFAVNNNQFSSFITLKTPFPGPGEHFKSWKFISSSFSAFQTLLKALMI